LFSVTQGGPTEDFVLSIVNWGAVALVLVNVLIWAILYLGFADLPSDAVLSVESCYSVVLIRRVFAGIG
jgi:hypothetical protein